MLDFCESKGLLKKKESWEISLESHLEKKDDRVKEIYKKLKLYKTKKKKLELLKECKETLFLTIKNPTMTIENLESEAYVNLKEEKERLEMNLTVNIVEKMTPNNIEDDLGSKPMNIDVTVTGSRMNKMTKNNPMKMTPNKKKTTARIKNSPRAMNVAKRLGLESLPSVKVMAERLQCTHLPSAKNEATNTLYKITKPICISSSLGVEQPDCTPVAQARQPMGEKQGSEMDQLEQGKSQKSCQSTPGTN